MSSSDSLPRFYLHVWYDDAWHCLGWATGRLRAEQLLSEALDERKLPPGHGTVTQHAQPPLHTPFSLPPAKTVSPTARGASTNKTSQWEAAKRRRR